MSRAGSPLRRPWSTTRAMQAALVALAFAGAAPGAWAGGRATPASASHPASGTRGAPFQFSVIGHIWRDSGGVDSGSDEAMLRRALADAGAAAPAFIVATGLKATAEPCSDKLYGQRRQLFNDVEVPLIVSLAGSDWTECLNSAGRSNAIERLNRLRELLFTDSQSLGGRRLTLTRQSGTAKFRSYAENAHWEYGNVLFATINLPAKNNHFRPEAGRNSEYEDRLVANRAWLHRLFALAEHRKLIGLVLFSDGDVGVQAERSFSLLSGFLPKQDGYAEPRRQIRNLAEQYKGTVLLVDAQGTGNEPAINWHGKVGHLSLAADWAEVRIAPGAATLFVVKGGNADAAPQ
ncbi:hypothetical protein H3H36_21065 [Duganella sp. FT3S]|uniref:Transmembrane protein n=2 Tax=Rugamonas fusca TaxID=2758568 RepID=A0A7W2I8T1_9BURK|nr:hypothetical protein [Rugamonas fusca]